MKVVFIVILLVIPSLILYGQESSKPQDQIKIEYDEVKVLKDNDEDVFIFSGKPILYHKELCIVADIMIAWGGKEKPGEIFAEGNVRVKTKGREIWADSFLYNPVLERGLMLNFKLRTPPKDQKPATLIKAEEARLVSKDHFKLKKVSVSTCTYSKPHTDIRVDELDLVTVEEKTKGTGYNITPTIGGVPIFYLPSFGFREDQESILKSISLGRTTRFGYYVLSKWGTDITKNEKDWGKIDLRLDYRRTRGYATGIDLDYKWEGYFGFLETYYLKDKGPNPDISFDRQFIPLENDDRGRIKFFHRQDFSKDIRGELELSYLSDKNLLQEFYQREFTEGKEQETLVYLRWQSKNASVTFLEKYRLNDFQLYQVEYLPQIRFDIFSEPFMIRDPLFSIIPLTDVYVSSFIELGLVRRRYTQEETMRFDWETEIIKPFTIGPVTLSPFVDERITLFDQDIKENSKSRLIGIWGICLNSQANKVFDCENDTLGIHKLRHTIDLDLQYTNSHSSLKPEELLQFDKVDALSSFEEVSISLKNRFETNLKEGNKTKIYKFLQIGLGIEYYPESQRDTTSFRQTNFTQPFNWITLAPDKNSLYEERRVSNIFAEIIFTPMGPFSLSVVSEFNTEKHNEEQRKVELFLTPVAGLSLSVGQDFSRGQVNAVSTSLSLKLADVWTLYAGEQYDLKEDKLLVENVRLRREFHDFTLEIGYQSDISRGDRILLFSIIPKFLGKDLLAGLSRVREERLLYK